jgi:ABC-type multidrug transport system fused ATPase/permease subunit
MITRRSTEDLPFETDKETGEFDWGLLSRFLVYLKPHIRQVILMSTMACLRVGAIVFIPVVLKIGIDTHIPAQDLAGLGRIAAVLVVLVVVLFVSARVQGTLVMRVGYRVLYQLRTDIFGHLQRLSFRFFDYSKAGKLMSRLTNDVQVLEELLRAGLESIVAEVLLLVGISVAMIILSPILSAILVVTVPLFALLVFLLRGRMINAGRRIQLRLSAVNAFLNESILGIKVIRAFAREAENSGNFQAVNDEYYQQTRLFYPLLAVFWQSVIMVSTIGQALVLFVGGVLLVHGLATLGLIVAFLSYITRFFQPMQRISDLLNQLSRAMASAERIFGIMDAQIEVEDAPNVRTDVSLEGAVTFNNVWFAYEEENYVAKDLTFRVEPGETVAIVGPTGSGKTTIINLLCRFYEPSFGTIEVDGINVRDIAQKAFRSQIAVVMQDTRIFSGTVLDNIRFSKPDAGMEEVQAVTRDMEIHEMIRRMPRGYHTELGERGASLSLGQAQLIAFARALLRNPAILILDEASSYLDSRTEEQVQRAMGKLSRGRTSFVIAHRLATVRDADRIMVMHQGRIVETGSHADLVAQEGRYAELLRTQYAEAGS